MSPKFKTFQVLALILCHRDWDFCAFLWYKSSTEQKLIFFKQKSVCQLPQRQQFNLITRTDG